MIDWRFADDNAERLPSLAAELVQLKVDVIVASGTTSAISASQKASTSIPIVMAGAADPVGDGFVLPHPLSHGHATVLRGFGHQSGLFETPTEIRPQPASATQSTSATIRAALVR